MTRVYDAQGRMSSETDWKANTTTFTYDADSGPAVTSEPSATGVADTTSYDNADMITAISDAKSNTAFATMSYTRDLAQQVTAETDTGIRGPNQTYSYTALERLGADNSAGYSYDSAGNPARQAAVGAQSYNPADELTQVASNAGAQMAAGGYHSLVVRADGTVWGSGLGTSGQLGSETSTSTSTPIPDDHAELQPRAGDRVAARAPRFRAR